MEHPEWICFGVRLYVLGSGRDMDSRPLRRVWTNVKTTLWCPKVRRRSMTGRRGEGKGNGTWTCGGGVEVR